MNKTDDIQDRILSIERTFDAPIALVWEAWTAPEHIAYWWGPQGMKTKIVEHQFEVGGKWKYTMEMKNGQEFISEGIFSEIVEPERIFTSAEFKPMTSGVELQTHFKEHGEKTNLIFNVVHPTAEYAKQQEEMGFRHGWGSVFDNLDAYLQQKKSA